MAGVIGPIRVPGLSTKGGVTRVTLAIPDRHLRAIGKKAVDKRSATGLSCFSAFATTRTHRILP